MRGARIAALERHPPALAFLARPASERYFEAEAGDIPLVAADILRDRDRKRLEQVVRRSVLAMLILHAAEQRKLVVRTHVKLERTEARIAGLIQFIADGDHSSYVRSTLADLEAQAKAEKAEIAAIEREAATPIRLPSPAELERLVVDIEARIAQDPIAGRAHLRRLLKDGRIVLEPQPDGVYLARAEALPGVLFGPEAENRRPGESPGAAMSRRCSGGVI